MSAWVAGHQVDAIFPDEKVIVELDSWDFHWSKQSFEDDRDADTAVGDHITLRITDERMKQQSQHEATRLHRILGRRRRLLGL
jgi:very-short-patch-repair endonuclease